MEELRIAILDLLDGKKPKTELLLKAKEIQKLFTKASEKAKAMSEDEQDEFSLDFGDKLFELLRK
jgi:hypothetical protein